MEKEKTSLFDLTGDWLSLYEMADDPDMDADAFFDTMEGIEGAIEDKADKYAFICTRLAGEAELCKKQATAFKAKAEARRNGEWFEAKPVIWWLEKVSRQRNFFIGNIKFRHTDEYFRQNQLPLPEEASPDNAGQESRLCW